MSVYSPSSSPVPTHDASQYSPTGRTRLKLDMRSVSKGSLQIDMSMRRNTNTTRVKQAVRSPLGSPTRPSVNFSSVSKGLVSSASGLDLSQAFNRRKKPTEVAKREKYDLKQEIYTRSVAWLNTA
jgi:hypothetical protein